MNRKNLTAAVLAGLAGVVGIAGSAQAVNINPDGTGQVLLYPYYTTNAGNVTLLSVVNTSDEAKAVKVRFMESENSQEVLDFNLYMSAYDVWTAAITPMGDEVFNDCDPNIGDGTVILCEGPLLNIAADETTCTVPKLSGMQPFLPYAFSLDGGSQAQARMNEGHFEMLEMGTLTGWAALAATHGAQGGGWAPADCPALVDAWTFSQTDTTKGTWLDDPTDGVEAPSGGLFGGGAIINAQAGAMHSYVATAINGWNASGFDNQGQGISIHEKPGVVKPNLGSGDTNQGLVFASDGTVYDSGTLGNAWDAVSYVLLHDTLMNEYTTEVGVAGETEWVVTFPTKRFYVDATFNPNAPVRPFTTAWEPITEDGLATACETVELRTMWDREEQNENITCEDLGNCEDKPVVSPPRPGNPDPARIPFELCYETNVIRFGAAFDENDVGILPDSTEILGSPVPNYRNIDNEVLGFQYGWARIDMDDYLEANLQNDGSYTYTEESRYSIGTVNPLNGLPFVGFSVSRFANNFLPTASNPDGFTSYGSLFRHKSSRKLGSDMP